MRILTYSATVLLAANILTSNLRAGQSIDNAALSQAEKSSRIAGYSLSKVKRWLHEVAIKKIDPKTGLYLGDGKWNYRDTAADCYPFLCWAAHVTDIDLLHGPIRDVLGSCETVCRIPGIAGAGHIS